MPIRRGRRRSHWIVVATCLAVLATATAVAVRAEPAAKGASAGARPGGSSTGSATLSPTSTSGGPHPLSFGIAYGGALLNQSAKQLGRSLDDAVALGVKWVRTDLPWDLVQPSGPRQYDWSSVDRVVNAAAARGLKVLPILNNPPYWARSSACKTQADCAPAGDSAYASFAAAAATRYAPKGVHAWEIWNEPNIGVWLPHPDPAAYEKLLAAASTALRRADRDAFVVLGGLAAVPTQPGSNYISAFDFLTAVARLGGTKYVNAVGYHPYSLPTLPSAAPTFQTISGTRDNLVAVLQEYGTPDVSIWLTETGAQVSEAKVGVTADPLRFQATYATDLVQTVARNPHVGADFWFSDQDFPGLVYGLHGSDGSPRPAFAALKAAIASCRCDSER